MNLLEYQWKKPSRKLFRENLDNPYCRGGWIGVRLNGSDKIGYSDGAITLFDVVPKEIDAIAPMSDSFSIVDFVIESNLWWATADFRGKKKRFATMLEYLGVIDNGNYHTGIFEAPGDNRCALVNNDNLSAILYYAKKVHGKKADVYFVQEERNGLLKREYQNPILIMVSNKPFAIIMPIRDDMTVDEARRLLKSQGR